MENKLLSSVKAGAVGACVFGLSQAAMAANVQISGQIDTYIECVCLRAVVPAAAA